MFGWKRPQLRATDKARKALWVAPRADLSDLADTAEAKVAALSVAEIAPPPPPKPSIPSDPDAHLRYAQRAVEQMDKDEAEVLGEIDQEKTVHATKLETLEGTLAGIRKTRAAYQQAAMLLSTESVNDVLTAKPPKARPRGRTAAEAEVKPEGQEAANE